MIGCVCINSVGRVGVVTAADGKGWVGFGLDGKGTWSTSNTNPPIVAVNLEVYRQRVSNDRRNWRAYVQVITRSNNDVHRRSGS